MSKKMHPLQNKDTHLRVTRKADKFTFETSEDGKTWTEVQVEQVKLTEQLKVGVLAINTTAAELSVKLNDLKLSPSPK